jgi:hypothetical protein
LESGVLCNVRVDVSLCFIMLVFRRDGEEGVESHLGQLVGRWLPHNSCERIYSSAAPLSLCLYQHFSFRPQSAAATTHLSICRTSLLPQLWTSKPARVDLSFSLSLALWLFTLLAPCSLSLSSSFSLSLSRDLSL